MYPDSPEDWSRSCDFFGDTFACYDIFWNGLEWVPFWVPFLEAIIRL